MTLVNLLHIHDELHDNFHKILLSLKFYNFAICYQIFSILLGGFYYIYFDMIIFSLEYPFKVSNIYESITLYSDKFIVEVVLHTNASIFIRNKTCKVTSDENTELK